METSVGCGAAGINHNYIDGGTVIFCTKCRDQAPKQAPVLAKKLRGMRRVKLFVETGYNDNSGTPHQAKVVSEAAQAACDSWITQSRGAVEVIDIQVTVDSKNHSGHAWNGACVTTISVHFYELL